MGKFQVHERIDLPASRVFRYISNLENTSHWYYATRSAVALDEPGAVLGARYEMTRELPHHAQVTDVVSVTEYDPPRAFAFGTKRGPAPFNYRYRLWDDEGTTEITLEADVSLPGTAKLLSPVMTQTFKREMQENLRSLKAMLEAA
jgi:hypothetical protein